MTRTREKYQDRRPIGSKVGVETNGRRHTDRRMEEFHGSVMRLAFACAAASLIKYPGHGTSNYDTEFRLFCLLLSAFNGEPNQVYM